MNKESIVYFKEEKFNGVLVILREPHDGNKDKMSVLLRNKEWFKCVISPEKNVENKFPKRQLSKYHNRLTEMLGFVNTKDLSQIAFTNINLQGGGASKSKLYDSINKEIVLSEIIEIVKPKIVFTVKDIFDSIDSECIKNGILYKNKTERCYSKKYNNIIYYEIIHPCRSPRIII